jgi:ABC-type lipoprotein release transport system permease subunit
MRNRAAILALVAVVFALWIPIAVLGLMQGWIDLTKRQVRAIEADLQLSAHRPMPEDLPATIADHPRIIASSPMIQTPAMLNMRARGAQNEAIGILVEGADLSADLALNRFSTEDLHRAPALDLREPDLPPSERGTGFITAGARADLSYAGLEMLAGLGGMPLPPPPRLRSFKPGIIVGRELAYQYRYRGNYLAPGERVTLSLPDGSGGLTGRVHAEVSDTIGTGIMEIDEVTVFTALPSAQQLTDQDGKNPQRRFRSVDGWRLRVTGDLDQARQELIPVIQNLPSSWWNLRTWQEVQGNRVRIHEVQRNLIYVVMVLVLFLCIFVVYAAFSTVVAEKRHDIGVLLAMGVRPKTICGAFYLAACQLALVGAGLGWAIGWLVLSLINPASDLIGIPLYPMDVIYAERAPISYDLRIPLSFMGIVTVIALIAATVPALRAARLNPITTLRENS